MFELCSRLNSSLVSCQSGTATDSVFHFVCRFLKSSIVELVVGQGDEQTILMAHQAILTTSPYFADLIEKLEDVTPVRKPFPSS